MFPSPYLFKLGDRPVVDTVVVPRFGLVVLLMIVVLSQGSREREKEKERIEISDGFGVKTHGGAPRRRRKK